MTTKEVQLDLQKIPQMKDFVWNLDDYTTMQVPRRHFKDSEKNEYRLGGFYSIYIAHMYEGEVGKEFFYIIIERKGERRVYRKHLSYPIEFNKRYISGKTVKEVIDNFKELFENLHDSYTFL